MVRYVQDLLPHALRLSETNFALVDYVVQAHVRHVCCCRCVLLLLSAAVQCKLMDQMHIYGSHYICNTNINFKIVRYFL